MSLPVGEVSAAPALKQVQLYTDGACEGNPGPGGYGLILRYGQHQRELSGGFRLTTNNRMELLAVIVGLETLKFRCAVQVVSDSRYVVESMEKGWALGWQRQGWHRGPQRGPVPNKDLWVRLLELCRRHQVRFQWVKGHAGHPENERADELAGHAAKKDSLPGDLPYEALNAPLEDG